MDNNPVEKAIPSVAMGALTDSSPDLWPHKNRSVQIVREDSEHDPGQNDNLNSPGGPGS